MFLGHFGVAMAAKKAAPKASLGTLVLAAQFADLLWPVFLLLGWERVRIAPGITRVTPLDFVSYPWSHSLLMDLAWGTALGAVYFALRRDGRGAWVVGACVPSHWVLDWIAHRPDMPLYPGGPRFGLGLWNSVPATLVVELVLFVAGAAIYLIATRKGSHRIVRILVVRGSSRGVVLCFDVWPASAKRPHVGRDRAGDLADGSLGRLDRPPSRSPLNHSFPDFCGQSYEPTARSMPMCVDSCAKTRAP